MPGLVIDSLARSRQKLFKNDAGRGEVIRHSCPYVEVDYTLPEIKRVLTSRMLAQGEVVRIFEEQITRYLGGYRTGCVGSGAAALLLALKMLGVEKGDEVILPSLVCRSVLEAVLASQASPILCDVGDDWVVTHDSIKPFVTKRTKVIIVPHLYGIKADVQAIQKLGVPIIEDCAQAFGRTIDNKRIGTESELSVFSFHPTKCLTAGEGGAVMINDNVKALSKKLFQLRDSTNSLKREIFAPMSDISAAIGISQMKMYDYFLRRRFWIAKSYDHVLNEKVAFTESRLGFPSSMFFRYVFKVERHFSDYARRFAMENIIVRNGVDLMLHRLLRQDKKRFNQTEYLFKHTLSLPIYPALSDTQVHKICRAINKVMR